MYYVSKFNADVSQISERATPLGASGVSVVQAKKNLQHLPFSKLRSGAMPQADPKTTYVKQPNPSLLGNLLSFLPSRAMTRAFRRLDQELFVAGLHDIVERDANQHIINRLTAFCGYSLSAESERGSSRSRIKACLPILIEDHLREIHPQVWANARLASKDRPVI